MLSRVVSLFVLATLISGVFFACSAPRKSYMGTWADQFRQQNAGKLGATPSEATALKSEVGPDLPDKAPVDLKLGPKQRAMIGHSRPTWFAGGDHKIAYFVASDDDHGVELFQFDGKETKLTRDILKGKESSYPRSLTRNALGHLVFTAYTPEKGRALYYYDESVFYAISTTHGFSQARELTPFGKFVVFSAYNKGQGREMWATMKNGTALLSIVNGAGSSFPGGFTVLDDEVYFRAQDASGDVELYVFNGSSKPKRVADINTKGSSRPTNLVAWNKRLWFVATDETEGRELFVYKPGTKKPVRVTNIHPKGDSSPSQLTPGQDYMAFVATGDKLGRELFVVDKKAKVQRISDFKNGVSLQKLTAAGNDFFFSLDEEVDDKKTGRELWKTKRDRKSNGIVDVEMVMDIRAGDEGSGPSQLTETSWGLLFRADDGKNGAEPWIWNRSTGKAALLADVHPGAAGSRPSGFEWARKRFLFAADDGKHGRELWGTDGSRTKLVADIDKEEPPLPLLRLQMSKGTEGVRLQGRLDGAPSGAPVALLVGDHITPPLGVPGFRGVRVLSGTPATVKVGVANANGSATFDVTVPDRGPQAVILRQGWPKLDERVAVQAMVGSGGGESSVTPQFICTLGDCTIVDGDKAAKVQVPTFGGCVEDVTREWMLTMERVPHEITGKAELEVGHLALVRHKMNPVPGGDHEWEWIPFAPGEESIPIHLGETVDRSGTVDFELPLNIGNPNNGSILQLYLFPYPPTEGDFPGNSQPAGACKVWQSYC